MNFETVPSWGTAMLRPYTTCDGRTDETVETVTAKGSD
jgi:hypothetical protein